jgi:hypothetical protein
MAVTPNLRKGTFACETVPRNNTSTKILMMATGQGLRERFRGKESACFGRNLQSEREGSKDSANGMERKVARSSSGARRAKRIVVEWSDAMAFVPDDV